MKAQSFENFRKTTKFDMTTLELINKLTKGGEFAEVSGKQKNFLYGLSKSEGVQSRFVGERLFVYLPEYIIEIRPKTFLKFSFGKPYEEPCLNRFLVEKIYPVKRDGIFYYLKSYEL